MSQRIEALPCLDGLTPRQVQVLNTITDFQNRFCYSPTIGELADRLDISRTTAFEHIEQLRKKGLISPPAGKARSLTPSSKARKLLSRHTNQQTSDTEEVSGGIPLVGRVAAGLALAGGLDLKTVARGLASLSAIPGRLENVKPPVVSGPVLSSVEVVEPDAPFTVLVDIVHGGAVFTLADLVFTAASNSHGTVAVAINASISFIKASSGGTLFAEVREIACNPKLATYSIDVTNEQGEIIAVFQGEWCTGKKTHFPAYNRFYYLVGNWIGCDLTRSVLN